MAETENDRIEVAKTFTRTRRIPQLIGRTSDGMRIPGGPYTMTQAIGGFVVGWLLYITMGLWGGSSAMWNWGMALTAVGVAVFMLGRMPIGGRNPVTVLLGFGNATVATRPTAVGGMAPPRSKIHAVTGSVLIQPSQAEGEISQEGTERKDTDEAASPVSEAAPVSEHESGSERRRDRRRPRAFESLQEPAEAAPGPERREPDTAEPRLRAIPGGRQDGAAPAASKTSVNRLLALAEQQHKKEA